MSLALCTSVLAAQAIIEFVFDVRFDRLWNRLGAGIRSRPRWFRFGLRRTFVHFSTPVSLGAHFATVAPLIVLWRLIDRRRRRLATLALMFCVVGCIAAGSRGPWLALGAVAVIFPLLARNPRLFLTSSAVLALLLSPILITELNDRIQYTQEQLDETGNTDSGHYRIALWLIYGDQIGEAGWFGDPALAGAEYAKAWSIDNSYLYLLLVGGWLGGGLFIWMVLVRLSAGIRTISRIRTGRNALTATVASFTACVLCMLNTWFNPCFAHLFWLTGALAINHARIASKDDRAAGDARRRRSRGGRSIQPLRASRQT
jgi:hypothetical protein